MGSLTFVGYTLSGQSIEMKEWRAQTLESNLELHSVMQSK
jgi:hypothetical protein